jgi:DtxR family Mn-dependent transcriptional regulator
MNSSTVENYLKAIYELEAKGDRVKTNHLANRLGIKAGTVSEMIKRLAVNTPPLLRHRHHQGVRLTAAGRKIALNVIRRHRLLETFLFQTLGLSWDEVHREAEVLEHHISDRVTAAIDRHLGYPRVDPHGEPIPDADGHILASTDICLSNIKPRRQFRVTRVVPESSELLQCLQDVGIAIGAIGMVIDIAPLGGALTIQIHAGQKAREHAIGRNLSDLIYVEALE